MTPAGASLYPFRLARRELRGGIGGLRVFVACLVLGVARDCRDRLARRLARPPASPGTRAHCSAAMSRRALAYRPADAAERAFLARSGAMSEIAQLRAMARTPDGERQSLIELKAVDAAYPLYGAVVLSPPQDLGAALGPRDGGFGAVVDPAILDRLGVKIGDTIKIGEAALQVRGTIAREPDAAGERADPRPAGDDLRRGARRNRADPARRAGHLSLPAAACRRRRCRSLDRGGAGRVSRGGLADAQLCRGGAPVAAD